MPPITRWMVKTSLLYLLAALLVGLLQPLSGALAGLGPVRVHLLVVGWLTLLIFGVVLWMFPKYSRELPRGHEWLAWASYGLLNAGLLLRVAGEGLALPGWVLALSALLQLLAALAFVANTWPRVKEK